MIQLSPDQQAALDNIVERLSDSSENMPCVTLGGYAGTGKTTLIPEIVKALRPDFPRIGFCAYTGRAIKDVLTPKLKAADILKEGDFIGTLHSLLYRPEITLHQDSKGRKYTELNFTSARNTSRPDLLIIDEASMVSESMEQDILALDIPILAVGDHGQLPPVSEPGTWMRNPDVRLEKIHRQAENSPIILLSQQVRETGQISLGRHNDSIIKTYNLSILDSLPDLSNWLMIAYTNRLRVKMNTYCRNKLGYANLPPQAGEYLICLKNNHAYGIYNGMRGTLTSLSDSPPHWYKATIQFNELSYSGRIFRYQFNQPKTLNKNPIEASELDPRKDFGDLFDYGYCLTAHKAQGSESDKVVVFEETFMRKVMNLSEEDWKRWLYTAVTRAKKQLIIIEN